MTTIWWTIIGLAVTTALVKAAGPVVFGGRTPHPAFLRVVAMMAPALLAALVVTSALVDQRQLGVGADTVGVLAGGVLLWRGHSVVLAVVVAVVVTAGAAGRRPERQLADRLRLAHGGGAGAASHELLARRPGHAVLVTAS